MNGQIGLLEYLNDMEVKRDPFPKRFPIGINDRNGNGIHEGDILLVNGMRFRIDWDQNEARFLAEATDKQYRYADHETWPMYNIRAAKIVGSVYKEENRGNDDE